MVLASVLCDDEPRPCGAVVQRMTQREGGVRNLCSEREKVNRPHGAPDEGTKMSAVNDTIALDVETYGGIPLEQEPAWLTMAKRSMG